MTERKKHLMAKFYELCKQKGYKDMSDSTQSLKAKVIATDLGLNYGDIVKFYNEAKVCYEQVCAEKAEQEKELLKQYEKDAEERCRRAVNGEWLLTLSGSKVKKDSDNSSDNVELSVYIRPDNSIYSEINNAHRTEGPPTIKAKKTSSTFLEYQPSQAVYTGATVGGITTGGVHYTKDGYSTSNNTSGKGEIEASKNSLEFTLKIVVVSDYIKDKFKRDSHFLSLVDNGKIRCRQDDAEEEAYRKVETAAKSGNYAMMMNAASMAAEECRLPYKKCKEITNLIGRIVNGQFPPTDEEIYATAEAYANATNSADLRRAIDAFKSLGNFRDSRQRANALKPKYGEILQYEKEQAVLAKEAKQKETKKIVRSIAFICNLLVTAVLAILVWPIYKEGTTIIPAVLAGVSTIISIPGTGKLIFRKKYGLLQRILRWVVVALVFLVGFVIFSLQQ